MIVVGGFAEYLTENKQTGANITKFNYALWWAVITITTEEYGDYTPASPLGRIIATIVMFSGIGIAVTLIHGLRCQSPFLPTKIEISELPSTFLRLGLKWLKIC